MNTSDFKIDPNLKGVDPNSSFLSNWGGVIGALGNASGSILNSAKASGTGYHTVVGDAIQGVAPALSMVPGIGPILSGAASLVGGVVNRVGGTDVNETLKKNLENRVENFKLKKFNASTMSDLLSLNRNFGLLDNSEIDDVATDGVLSKKGQKMKEELYGKFGAANTTALASFANSANQVDQNIDRIALQNKFGKGGNLHSKGALWDNDLIFINTGGSHESNPYEGVPMGVDNQGVPNLVEEGEVIWDDYVFSNRLTVPKEFKHKYKIKGKKEYTFADMAEKISEESKERPNDPISKRGRDAILSALKDTQDTERKKKQQQEASEQFNSLPPEQQVGIMQMAQQQFQQPMQGGPEEDMNMGYMDPNYMEQAPMMQAYGGNLFGDGGVKGRPEGMKKSEARRNLRLTDQYNLEFYKELAKRYGIDVDKLNEEWFKPYAHSLNITSFNNLYKEAQKQKALEAYIEGKKKSELNARVKDLRLKYSDDKSKLYAAKTATKEDEQKPYVGSKGNRLTEGNYNTIKNLSATYSKNPNAFNDREDKDKIIAAINDFPNIKKVPIKEGEFIRTSKGDIVYGDTDVTDTWANDLNLEEGFKWDDNNALSITLPTSNNNRTKYLRYAPALGAGIGLLENIFNKPDYSAVDSLMKEANVAGGYTPITYTPIGNYLTYNPVDINYHTNKLNANTAATRRALMNSSNPSNKAALLAADYTANNKLGDLYRSAEDTNFKRRQEVESFNRGTNSVNAEMSLKAQMANTEAERQAKAARAGLVSQAIKLQEDIDTKRAATRSSNFTNLFKSLGQIGEEAYDREALDNLIDRRVLNDIADGVNLLDWRDEGITEDNNTKKYGGKIKKCRKSKRF